jgi:hypothetical protein
MTPAPTVTDALRVPARSWRTLDPRTRLTAAEAELYGIAKAGTVRQWARRGITRGRRLFSVGVDDNGSPLYPLPQLLKLAGLASDTPPEGIPRVED